MPQLETLVVESITLTGLNFVALTPTWLFLSDHHLPREAQHSVLQSTHVLLSTSAVYVL